MENKNCKICKNKINDWGKNGKPLVNGLVCSACNQKKVIPYRVIALKNDCTFLEDNNRNRLNGGKCLALAEVRDYLVQDNPIIEINKKNNVLVLELYS